MPLPPRPLPVDSGGGRPSFGTRAAVSAIAATLTSTAALAVAARLEERGALQPLNATSHWLNGDDAGEVAGVDLRHTGVGFATHAAATLFWAVLFEAWIGRRRPRPLSTLVVEAAAMSAVAAAVDYLATPKRFTPGWEFVLSVRGMAIAYAGMAAGLAAGVWATDRARERRHG